MTDKMFGPVFPATGWLHENLKTGTSTWLLLNLWWMNFLCFSRANNNCFVRLFICHTSSHGSITLTKTGDGQRHSAFTFSPDASADTTTPLFWQQISDQISSTCTLILSAKCQRKHLSIRTNIYFSVHLEKVTVTGKSSANNKTGSDPSHQLLCFCQEPIKEVQDSKKKAT